MNECSILWCGKYHQNWENELHCHNYFQMVGILSGSGTVYVDDQPYEIEKEQVFLLCPQQLHAIHCGEKNAAPLKMLDVKFTVADASKCRIYMKNFGEFYNNQIEHASAIILSRTQNLPEDKLAAAVALLRGHNEKAPIVTTPWDALTGAQLLDAMEQKNSLMAELTALAGETAHTHHHHEDGCTCEACRHEHGHDEHRHDHGDEHCHDEAHAHGGNCCHSAEEHHHGEDCTCGTCRDGHGHNHAEHHHHSHEGHHHADEVFTSWGMESPRKFTEAEVAFCLTALDSGDYGAVLRAKGIVPAADGTWLHFDYVPGEQDIRTGAADYTGRLCVIGAQLNEAALKTLFGGEA